MAKEVKDKLSRKDMEDVIKGGGSVLIGGNIVSSVKDLPDDADLAETEEELNAAVAAAEEEEKAAVAKKTKATTKAAAKKGGKK